MKYKAGDIAIVKNDLIVNKQYGSQTFMDEMQKLKGKEIIIEAVYENKYSIYHNKWYWTDEMLEDIKPFTKEDMRDADIVIYKDGTKDLWDSICQEDYGEDLTYTSDYGHINPRDYDIIKVERPIQLELVFVRKEEILTKN